MEFADFTYTVHKRLKFGVKIRQIVEKPVTLVYYIQINFESGVKRILWSF